MKPKSLLRTLFGASLCLRCVLLHVFGTESKKIQSVNIDLIRLTPPVAPTNCTPFISLQSTPDTQNRAPE